MPKRGGRERATGCLHMAGERRGRGQRTRGGGREARRAARAEARPAIVPYVTRRVPVYDVMSTEGLELIEHNAETILEEVGVEFRDDPEALSLWRGAGADVDAQRVRIPRGLARKLVTESAPVEFVQHARNPARSARIGGPHMVFAPAYGPPVHPQPRRRPALRHHRGLPQLREAHLALARPPPRGWNSVRTRRPARQQAPPRHGVQPSALLRQAVHGLGHGTGTRGGHCLHGDASCSETSSSRRTPS